MSVLSIYSRNEPAIQRRIPRPEPPKFSNAIFLNDMELRKKEYLEHAGTPHQGSVPHSGRYPYGSGEHPFQGSDFFRGFGDQSDYYRKKYNDRFNDCYNGLKKDGMTDSQIAEMLGIPVANLKARVSISKAQEIAFERSEIIRMANSDPSLTKTAIAKCLGISEGKVRKVLKEETAGLEFRNETLELVDQLKQRVDEKGYVDVSEGNSYWINQTKSKLDTAAKILQEQGYTLEEMHVKQVFGENYTNINVLAKPGTTRSEIGKNLEKVVPVFDPKINEEATLMGLDHPPVSIDSSRIAVVYDEEGGSLRDGMIGIRRGVADLDLGKSNIAQVRIAVDGTHYIKGVATYKDDDIPEGKDLVIYSNKKMGTPLTDPDPDAKTVLKPMKRNANGEIDEQNPFGAMIKSETGQSFYTDKNGEEKLSAINKVNEEGDWEDWSGRKYISSQMLSKQPVVIAVKQLDLAVAKRSAELENIQNVANPTIRKKLLEDYANACDSAAVDLQGAAFPKQQTHVLLPLPNMADNQVYAPNYPDGSHVILIRFPHASINEIPYLQVNNKNNAEGDKVIGRNARDAIGISPKTAAQLSGADYDGDTALVIPADNIKFNYDKPLRDLVKFDPKKEYPYREGMKVMSKADRGREMGIITNLITDMTAQGCNDTDQLVRAIKHSMVVIDAEKHKLDYQKSYVDNRIGELHKEWQGRTRGGAKTLISKASGPADILDRREGQKVLDPETGKEVFRKIDPETGEKLYTYTGKVREGYTDKKGKYHPPKQVTQKSTKMMKALTTGDRDARTLSSGTAMEEVYARYANQCHSLGNKARKQYLITKDDSKVNESARKAYSKQITDISMKVAEAKKHAPLERQATILANNKIREFEKENPNIRQTDPDKYKKVKSQYQAGARNRFGGGRKKLVLTDKEWEAVDSGAVGKTLLNDVIRYMDSRDLKSHVLSNNAGRAPSSAMKSRVTMFANSGYTNADIAESLGISPSTVSKILSGEV